jgi:hypothetical protein
MRLYAPLYEGDNLLRPDAALGERAVTVFKIPAPAAGFVRSNNTAEAAQHTGLNFHTINHNARAERGSEFAHLLKGAYMAVVDWLERIDTRERDNFFAGAENLADLENRQRHFERTGCAHY